MGSLFQSFSQRLRSLRFKFKRFLYYNIDWNERMIAIVGARGTGKTTLILQYIKENLPRDRSVLYASLDDLFFSENKLVDLVADFVSRGGKYLFLDEVHKYPSWSVELKNIYDIYPELKIVFSGSSVLQIFKGQADLSRRVTVYHLPELSLREYLAISKGIELPAFSLEEILASHEEIANQILDKVKIFSVWQDYLQQGAYPFFRETSNYQYRLKQVVNQILETDLPAVENLNFQSVVKLKRLLYVISTSSPFQPNMTKLAERLQIERHTLYKYFDLLQRAGLISLLYSDKKGISFLTKPDKVFLRNTNLLYLLSDNLPNIGTVRETFFLNMVSQSHRVNYPKTADFLVDGRWLFEIGGKSKTKKQVAGKQDAFIAADDIEIGFGNKIPLWLFGFSY